MIPTPAPAPTRWPDPRWVQAQRLTDYVRKFVAVPVVEKKQEGRA